MLLHRSVPVLIFLLLISTVNAFAATAPVNTIAPAIPAGGDSGFLTFFLLIVAPPGLVLAEMFAIHAVRKTAKNLGASPNQKFSEATTGLMRVMTVFFIISLLLYGLSIWLIFVNPLAAILVHLGNMLIAGIASIICIAGLIRITTAAAKGAMHSRIRN